MSSFVPKEKDIERKWYILDAAEKPLGRVSAAAAVLLRGKHKPEFMPHADCGDFVIIVNADKLVLTGNKLEQKMYRRHTGHVGGLKEVKARIMLEKNPEKMFMQAVKGMLPDTTIGRKSLTRLRVYRGMDHDQAAQKPENYEF